MTDYDAQLDELEGKVRELKAQIEELHAQVDDFKGHSADFTIQSEELKTQIDAIEILHENLMLTYSEEVSINDLDTSLPNGVILNNDTSTSFQ